MCVTRAPSCSHPPAPTPVTRGSCLTGICSCGIFYLSHRNLWIIIYVRKQRLSYCFSWCMHPYMPPPPSFICMNSSTRAQSCSVQIDIERSCVLDICHRPHVKQDHLHLEPDREIMKAWLLQQFTDIFNSFSKYSEFNNSADFSFLPTHWI